LKNKKIETAFDKKNEESLIEELEKELSKREDTIKHLKEELADSMVRIQDMIEKNRSLEAKINKYELQDVSMKIGKFEELKQNYKKLDHRTQITKKQLDDLRKYSQFTETVITDLEKRGFIDLILRRYPESYQEYITKEEE
jgi:chromosome segregation ATPase